MLADNSKEGEKAGPKQLLLLLLFWVLREATWRTFKWNKSIHKVERNLAYVKAANFSKV